MAESVTRKGTREKKVPKYLKLEETEYASFLGTKPNDAKDKPLLAQETLLLAKILTKFLNNINLKYKEYQSPDLPLSANPQKIVSDRQAKRQGEARGKANRAATKESEAQGNDWKKNNESREISKAEGGKKGQSQARLAGSNGNIAGMTDYPSMLSQHMGKIYANGGNYIEPESLKTMDLAKQLIDRNKPNKSKEKQEKADKHKEALSVLPGKFLEKGAKFQLKLFKRQSFHIAVAYYIHTVKVKLSNGDILDPTYNARKMREAALRQQRKTSEQSAHEENKRDQ